MADELTVTMAKIACYAAKRLEVISASKDWTLIPGLANRAEQKGQLAYFRMLGYKVKLK